MLWSPAGALTLPLNCEVNVWSKNLIQNLQQSLIVWSHFAIRERPVKCRVQINKWQESVHAISIYVYKEFADTTLVIEPSKIVLSLVITARSVVFSHLSLFDVQHPFKAITSNNTTSNLELSIMFSFGVETQLYVMLFLWLVAFQIAFILYMLMLPSQFWLLDKHTTASLICAQYIV